MPSDRDADDSVDEFDAQMEAFREHMDEFWEKMAEFDELVAEYEELVENSDLTSPAEKRETDAPAADPSDVEMSTPAHPDVTDSTWIASDTTVSLDVWR